MCAQRALFGTKVTRVTDRKNFQGHLLHLFLIFSLIVVHAVFPCQLETLIELGDRIVMERPVCSYVINRLLKVVHVVE